MKDSETTNTYSISIQLLCLAVCRKLNVEIPLDKITQAIRPK